MPAEDDFGRRQAPTPNTPSYPQAPPEAPDLHFDRAFASERSHSDRLPSGERYQGCSERYPLGTTSISTDRLAVLRYPERYTSLDRFNNTYHHFPRNQEYHTEQNENNGRYPANTDRYRTLSTDKVEQRYHSSGSGNNSEFQAEKERRNSSDRYRTLSNSSVKEKERNPSTSSDRDRYTPTERYNREPKGPHYSTNADFANTCSLERFNKRYFYDNSNNAGYQVRYHHPPPQAAQQDDRFPTIPCPERFATDRFQYMEPPSPAPANDRFVPPPPLSPQNTPTTPDCFTNNAFPSPTNPQGGVSERFIPPPPLTSSPTEVLSPKGVEHNRYYKDRYQQQGFQATQNYMQQVPQNPHMPVERYVPQPQIDNYYGTYHYDRYPTGSKLSSSTDPYMRRDLTAFHYRFSIPYPTHQNQYQRIRYIATPSRTKCCKYAGTTPQEPYATKSPVSSSNSSLTSQTCPTKDLNINKECQTENGTQCSPRAPQQAGKTSCRHSICASPSVEYVGGSGGRLVCATPPPRVPQDSGVCDGGCCTQRKTTTVVWRTPQSIPHQSPPMEQHSTRSTTPLTCEESTEGSVACTESTKSPLTVTIGPTSVTPPVLRKSPQPQTAVMPSHTRAVSVPATAPERGPHRINYSQSERRPEERIRNRPTLERSTSRKDQLKNYIKRETATFFGINENNEQEQQTLWLDRRKRLANRKYGPLKEEYCTPTMRHSHRRTVSELPHSSRQTVMSERPDVLPGPSDDVPDAQERVREVDLRRKDSVARMTWDGLSYVVTTLTKHRPRPRSQQTQASRSYPSATPSVESVSEEDTHFFNEPALEPPPRLPLPAGGDTENIPLEEQSLTDGRSAEYQLPPSKMWKRRGPQRIPPGVHENMPVGGGRIQTRLIDSAVDNSDRRKYGMGWIGKMFGKSLKKSVAQDRELQEQLDDIEDYRPMFTYWVTIVQVLVLFISLICYGFGPFGVDLHSRSGQVLVTNLALQQVDYMEPANFWLGPRAADLIHLGAKFAPCMRIDEKIGKEITKIKAMERDTACCIRNDDSGCVQASKNDCSETISTWKKWSDKNVGPGGRISGSVCGLDPKFCDAPASVHPYEWPDDITKWPICRKSNIQSSMQKKSHREKHLRDKHDDHMECEIIGHPCCIGIHGKCKITTKEYCDFVRGSFHEEASLCSQVSCLNDVCGMLPFYFPDVPDQFYRLWTSLFLHAGVLQLAVTVLIQHFLMRDLEKLTGSLRIGIIYLGSGVAGNLASSIFVPYRADVGPAGSQFGLLACLIVEVLNVWPMLKNPKQALLKLIVMVIVLFFIGLLPWVDNYAHLFGFLFGFLLSYALLPFISFGTYDRHKKIALIWICLLTAGFLFIALVIMFYVVPVYDCEICSYFNCIPFTRDFCASQNINFKREENIV